MNATTENVNQTVKSQPDNSVHKSIEEVIGKGRYSAVAMEVYRDSQRLLGLTAKQAEKTAIVYQTDLGRYFASANVDGIKIGNAGKSKNWDGQVTLKESVEKVKGHLTHAMCIAKLCNTLQEAKRYGIESYDDIKLSSTLTDWLNT